METQNYAVGLDIGTTKIVAIVGRKNANGRIDVMGFGRSESKGIDRGVVANVPQAIESIKIAIEQAQIMAKVPIKNVVVGIAGKHIRSMQHTDYITRDDPEQYITQEDIDQLKEQVNKLALPAEEQIIHILPQDFRIDSEGDIYQPIGMHGKRVEANFHVVIGRIASIRNIIKCIKEAGLEMDALTLEPLASAQSVLTNEEREAGVAIVDIGGGTTDIAIFKDNIIRHTCVIPYGGKIITEDIKTGCSIIERKAEELKKAFGSVDPDDEKENAFVSIPGQFDLPNKEISLKNLANIIRARYDEILSLVQLEFKAYGINEPKKKLISGLVLTGGGSNLKHIRKITNFNTGFETRIGVSNEYINNDKNQHLKSPEYATSIGLLMEGLEIAEKNREELIKEAQIKEEESRIFDKEILNLPSEDTQEKKEEKSMFDTKAHRTVGQRILDKVSKIGKFFDDEEN